LSVLLGGGGASWQHHDSLAFLGAVSYIQSWLKASHELGNQPVEKNREINGNKNLEWD
jgi:hypothetical protein